MATVRVWEGKGGGCSLRCHMEKMEDIMSASTLSRSSQTTSCLLRSWFNAQLRKPCIACDSFASIPSPFPMQMTEETPPISSLMLHMSRLYGDLSILHIVNACSKYCLYLIPTSQNSLSPIRSPTNQCFNPVVVVSNADTKGTNYSESKMLCSSWTSPLCWTIS